jgi:hydroxymethylglutaryl-CoA lyase
MNLASIKSSSGLTSSLGGQGIKLLECPRDAMQGWKTWIPTEKKVTYLNSLLQVGFDTIDFGSFVSPKAIPQMADTKEVVPQLKVESSNSKLLAIVANARGAQEAMAYDEITYLGFPFSVSPTFQQLNTKATIDEAFGRVAEIQNAGSAKNKQLVVYISMGFGNPYGDAYSEEIVLEWVDKLVKSGIKTISLADTVGLASAEGVNRITSYLVNSLPGVEIGVHLHSTQTAWKEKTAAAFEGGCRRFDGALKGIGGCPMANDELVANMDSELMIPYFQEKGLLNKLEAEALQESSKLASDIFQDF